MLVSRHGILPRCGEAKMAQGCCKIAEQLSGKFGLFLDPKSTQDECTLRMRCGWLASDIHSQTLLWTVSPLVRRTFINVIRYQMTLRFLFADYI